MKTCKKLLSLLLATVTLLSLASCNVDLSSLLPDAREPEEVEKPSYATQTVTYNNFTFEIPDAWEKIDAADGSGRYVAVPSADKPGSSTFNIEVGTTQLQKYTLVKFREAMRKSLPQQVAEIYPDAAVSEFEYSDFSAPCGKVFVAKYTVTQPDGAATTFTQYFPLIDYYIVQITAEDKGDGITPDLNEVCRYAANTLTLQEEQASESTPS